MPSARIFEIPYCFKVIGIKHRHRNPSNFILRDSVPVQVACLDTTEAPIRLRARLKAAGAGAAVSQIDLRHDGESYLREVNLIPTERGAAAPPFTVEDFDRMLRWAAPPFPNVHGENDKPAGILTTVSPELTVSENGRQRALRPENLQSLNDVTPLIRDWIQNDNAKARLAAARAGASFAIIDRHLYRRVGAPVAAFSTPNQANFFHSDQINDIANLGHGNWMPITYADAIPALSGSVGPGGYEIEIDAPLEQDHRANLAFVSAAILPQCLADISMAVEDMSANGMAAFRTFRENYAAALRRDLDAGLTAMEAMRIMAADKSFSESFSTLKMRKTVIPKLAFFDAMAERSGLITSLADEEALTQIAI
jgi:hypothetical protein